MKKIYPLLFPLMLLAACTGGISPERGPHDLVFEDPATSWDEGIPLGNGMLGALVWQKDNKLRISLDRADLWDLRPMAGLDLEEYNYQWVCRQWENNTYDAVQGKLDIPYNERPGPTKIPAGALEFNIGMLGETEYVRLYLDEALCEVKWMNGTILRIFVDAAGQAGWFSFDRLGNDMVPELLPPAYTVDETGVEKNISTETNLTALGYDEGTIGRTDDRITYTQEGWGGFEYTVDLKWERGGDELTGCWSISSEMPGSENETGAADLVDAAFKQGMDRAFGDHSAWWDKYWNRSAINIPDKLLEKQWYLEMYKFGSAARDSTPPIPLQGLWTADNGMLPPWKGDFHHDLNTQLSYWPAYSSNHLDLEEGFINWLWKYRPVFEKYTEAYYASGGLNVPGVTTLTGEPMGGWIQYSLGPTVAAWLGHHFYLHWRYSMDSLFLAEKAYPWLGAVARHFDNIAVAGVDGRLKLPLSSSPEINDNSRDAWFSSTTNFDLALIRWTYSKASEMALALGKNEEASQWHERLAEWPGLAVDEETGLMIAPGHPYKNSHRHFSHLMAWHPLGLLDVNMGADEKEIINNTLDNLLEQGTGWW
ncbi:MAG: glycoside hydrolase N-terminal domain-containing protein, partial [Bacteroidales bacterium]|nr:glycoside hydrolase N-terminal domain-containing protein [Bacteroidales bacterium]